MRRVSLILRPEVEQDLSEARDWYERQRSGLGRQFLDQVSTSLEQIATGPEMDDLIWEEIRGHRLRRFPYLIYYRIVEDWVEILAVLHGSRNPTSWQERL